jgi:hypothetical protein
MHRTHTRSLERESFSNNKAVTLENSTSVAHGDSAEEVAFVRKTTGIKWAIVVLAILSSTFLYALDNTIVANIRPGIIRSLGHIDMLPWVTVAYPLGEVGSCPFW